MLQARPELASMAMSYGDEHRPLHFAVMNRSPETVSLLMQHGASAREGIDPHRDATAWTPAKDRGFDEIVAAIEDQERRQERPAVEAEEQQQQRGVLVSAPASTP